MLRLSLLVLCVGAAVCVPRGADPRNAGLYKGSQFHCADGSQSFPMEYVNDDYCDCNDGSDEPGTAACSNGHFFCINQHFKGQLIASSRVDDGICDCCDGSDEISGKCVNNCRELGAHIAEEAKKIRREQAMGFNTRLAYIADGKAAKARRDQDISVFRAEEEKLRAEMDERKAYKEEVEAPATEAKKAAKAVLEKQEEERKAAEKAKHRATAEMTIGRIDKDTNGEISQDELLEYAKSEESLLPYEDAAQLVEGGEIETATLLDMIQTELITREEDRKREEDAQNKREAKKAKKPKLRDVQVPNPSPVDEEELWGEDGKKIERRPKNQQVQVDEFEDDFDDDLDDYEEVEDDLEDYNEDDENVPPVRNNESYDPETQRLIDRFEEAEKLYNEAKSQHENINNQLREVEKLSDMDFGKEEEFFVLKGQCFEKKDEKYRYKLCPYDRSDQDGTNIGRWEGWEKLVDGSNNYSVMMYTKGNSCWQGPQRSTRVEVVCGAENMIISASEPAKCEYAYVFATPAACHKVQEENEIHDEL